MSRKSKAAEFVDVGPVITVTGRNLLVTEAMKNYALEKIAKIERFSLRIIDINVTMDVQKLVHRCDIVMKVDQMVVKSEGTSENMYAAIDKAVDKAQAQLRRYHGRIRDHQARGLPSTEVNVDVIRTTPEESLEDEIFEVNNEMEKNRESELMNRYRFHKVIDKDKMPLKLLNQDEAVMKIELSGDSFMVYRAEEDMKLKVIYRRDDGNFGIIEPEI